MAKTRPFSIRLDEDIKEQADKACRDERRNLSNLIEIALAFYLQHKGKQK